MHSQMRTHVCAPKHWECGNPLKLFGVAYVIHPVSFISSSSSDAYTCTAPHSYQWNILLSLVHSPVRRCDVTFLVRNWMHLRFQAQEGSMYIVYMHTIFQSQRKHPYRLSRHRRAPKKQHIEFHVSIRTPKAKQCDSLLIAGCLWLFIVHV